MRPWILRIVFGGLLFCPFVKASPQEQVDWTEQAPGAIIRALSKQGLVVQRVYQLAPRGIPPVIAFTVSGCGRALQVVYLQINLTEAPFLEAAAEADYTRRYIYLGKIWTEPDMAAVRLAWLKQRLLSIIGRSPFVMQRMALFVLSPPDCDAVERIDWARIWKEPISANDHWRLSR